MEFFIKKKLKEGFNCYVTPQEKYGLKFLNFGVLSLSKNQCYKISTKNKEVCLVILQGSIEIKHNNKIYTRIGKRKDVFEGNPYAFYAANQGIIEIKREEKLVEIGLISVQTKKINPGTLIKPSQVKVSWRGKSGWRRQIRDIIWLDFPSQHLLIGETLTLPGNWGTYPPHRHEKNTPPHEAKMEEIFFYRIKPTGGFGFQGFYTESRSIEDVYLIKENSAGVFPWGYHTVASAAGYSIYYLWMLAGKKRIPQAREDPQHIWIKKS